MATASRRTLCFCEPWPLHRPHHCNYLRISKLCWVISLAFLLAEVEASVSSQGCLERERDALLLFKAAIEDPSVRLSSWRARTDCCAWTGVVCHNRTGSVRVAQLNLENPNVQIDNNTDTALRGELLHPSLLSLKHLQSLNLSGNDFEDTQIPPLVGSLRRLRYLDLSQSNFSGTVPPHLGNLTNLRYLGLRSFYFTPTTVVHSLDWLSGLSSLMYLDMSFLDLSAASHNWVSAINMLPSLQQLILYDCSLSNIISLPLNSHLNLTSLRTLNLGWNNFNSSFPNWLWNLTTLSSLKLYHSGIREALPNEIGNLISLTYLDLSWNLLDGPLPDGIMNLSSLSTLKLTDCSLSGPIPIEIGELSNLNVLYLSYNFFEGEITELHLSNLTKLVVLSLIGNRLITIPIKHTWTPPFQLLSISLGDCKLGPKFPAWFRSQQSLTEILLCDTSIEGNLPEWFWNSFSNITFLDLSNNKITGTLPASLESLNKLSSLSLGSNLLEGPIHHLPPNIHFLDLSFNAFSGPLPPAFFMQQLNVVFLSHNHINGSIPSNICNSHTLEYLGLSNNKISGEIPQCWQEGSFLKYLHLGNNTLSGEIPSFLGNLTRLQFLHLNNNNLKGHLPSSLQDCKQLVIVDLGDNKLSGNIPSWIGQSWLQLRILQLRSNTFDGNIDPQLGYMKNLQIIDLANNNLSGAIPSTFGNLSSMILTSPIQLEMVFHMIYLVDKTYWDAITLVIKGSQYDFSSILYLVKSIDLSDNSLIDEIPKDLGYLVGLQTLNLSRNYFTGKIPDSIGRMSSLETLDLSFNNLSGVIPQGLAVLNALNHLNLSYNNLSGNIPSGNQLQTLDDATIYIGNPYLCGGLVNKSCFLGNNIDVTSKEHTILSPMLSIWFSSALGYIVGLWSVYVLLLLKKKWRYSYFKKVDEIYDKFVAIKIRLNREVNDLM